MADEARGCLLFAIPARILGGRRPKLLPGPNLPALDPSKTHRVDLPVLVKARRAAEGCVAALSRTQEGVGPAVLRDVGEHLAGLLGHVYAMGERLAEGRRFLEAHDPDRLARERSELELELVGAQAGQIQDLKRAMASLERRAGHVGKVAQEVDQLASRLGAAVAELQELEARLAAELGSEELLYELRAYQQAAELALEAYNQTWRELGS